MPLSTAVPIARPEMPSSEDELRSKYCRMRRKLLEEDFDQDAADYLEQLAGPETAQLWGAPDTSHNPLASHTRQLVTPGLYGRTPTVVVPEGGDVLMGADGLWNEAGIWPRNQGLQYLTVGSGIWFRRLHVVDLGRGEGTQLVDRLVDPADVYVEVDEANPMVPVVFWELRKRRRWNGSEWERFYAWDQFDLRKPGAPRFRIVRCDAVGTEAEDITAQFASAEVAAGKYEWMSPEGLPFLPYITYRAVDSGCFWPHYRRAVHRGTLRATAHWTYTGRAALFATGEHLIISGIESLPGAAVHGDLNRNQTATPVHSLRVQPGTITLVAQKEGQQMASIRVGPGVNLPNLLEFSNVYDMLLGVADGLQPADVMRDAANPTSGAALAISAESRREFSAQVLPFFRTSDTQAIRKAAWMMLAAGIEVPDQGYSIEYHTIALTPSEQEELREDLEWKEKNGQMSPIDVHLQLFPGKTREQAREAIIVARVEAAQVEAEVAARVEAARVASGAGSAEDIQKTAYNGAQVDAAREYLLSGAAGQLPRGSVKGSLKVFFQLTDQDAEELLDSIGQGFQPAKPIQPGAPSPSPQE